MYTPTLWREPWRQPPNKRYIPSKGPTTLQQSLTATLSFNGSITKLAKTSKDATLSFNGALAPKVKKNLTATLSFSGSLTTLRKILQSLSATLSFTSSQSIKVKASKSATLSFTVDRSTLVKKSLAGVLSFTGSLTSFRKLFKTLTASLSFTGEQTKKVLKHLPARTNHWPVSVFSISNFFAWNGGETAFTSLNYKSEGTGTPTDGGMFTSSVGTHIRYDLFTPTYAGTLSSGVYVVNATITGAIKLFINNSLVETVSGITAAGWYLFADRSVVAGDVISIRLESTSGTGTLRANCFWAGISGPNTAAYLLQRPILNTSSKPNPGVSVLFTKRIRSTDTANIGFVGTLTKLVKKTIDATLSFTGSHSGIVVPNEPPATGQNWTGWFRRYKKRRSRLG